MPATAQRRVPVQRHRGKDTISVALEQVLSRYAQLVKLAARQRSLSQADIDEVLQDVRIRLWRALSTGDDIAGAPASYVYRTAVSAAIDLIRRRRARREVRLEAGVEGAGFAMTAGPEGEVDSAELSQEVSRAIGQLVDSRRLVVRMHLAGYHRHEIAKHLGWTEAKTRNLLYRGLSDVRDSLKGGQDRQ